MERLSDIFADLESQFLINQKHLFLSVPLGITFEQAQTDYRSKIAALEKANIETAQKAYNQAESFLIEKVKSNYNRGLNTTLNQLQVPNETIEFGTTERSQNHENNTKSILNRVMNIAVYSAIGAFTQIVANLINYKTITDDIFKAIDLAQSQYLAKGVVGNVSVAGAETNIVTYADILQGESEHKALLTGQGDGRSVANWNYIIISQHGGSCPKCVPWENKVLIDDYFSDGKPDGTTALLSTAINEGLFHPNCRHKMRVWRGPQDSVYIEKDMTPEVNKRQYEAQQKQHYYERGIREWKRRETGSLTEEERLKAHNKVLEWQAKQREHIKQSNNEFEIKLFRDYAKEQIGGASKPNIIIPKNLDDTTKLMIKYNVSNEEMASVHSYMSSESYVINEKLRKGQELSKAEQTTCNNLDMVLEKLQKAKGVTLIRDLIFSDESQLEEFVLNHEVGNIVEYQAYSSATSLTTYQQKPTVRLVINNATKATDLTMLNGSEKEFIYRRNQKFRVKEITNRNDIWFVDLEEMR